jgi:hypothetical protein
MRAFIITTALVGMAVPAAAQPHQHGQPAPQGQHADHAGHTNTGVPEGWRMRLDRPNSTAPVHFMAMDEGLHAILGPAGIFYNPSMTATGAFTAQGTFTLNKPAEHPEAFGLMVGGRDLDGADQDYLYFLVRQDGQFLVKHRAGTETHTLIDWTEHAAVARPGADGRAVNALAVESGPAGVRFLVNGQQVGTLPRQVNTDGIVGLRLNHNLDVTVADLAVHPAGHAGH